MNRQRPANAVALPKEEATIMDHQCAWELLVISGGEVVRLSETKPDSPGFLALEQSPGHLLNSRAGLFYLAGEPEEVIDSFINLVTAQWAKRQLQILVNESTSDDMRGAAIKGIEVMAMRYPAAFSLLEGMLSSKPLWWPQPPPSEALARLIEVTKKSELVGGLAHRLHDLQTPLDKVMATWARWSSQVQYELARCCMEAFLQHSGAFQCLATAIKTNKLKDFQPENWPETVPDHLLLKVHPQGAMVHLRVSESDQEGSRWEDFVDFQRRRMTAVLGELTNFLR